MTRRIDTEAEIDWIRLADQGSDPASPAAGYKYFYAKSGGIYLINSAGSVVGPFAAGIATDTIWDAAGDIVQGTGANTAAKLSIGTAYQILRVNSGATALEYASAGRVLISEQTPTGTATVTWGSIPATFKSLEIEYIARSTNASTSENMNIYFNNDTTATNYRRTTIAGRAASTLSAAGDDTPQYGAIPGSSSPAGSAGSARIKIFYYAQTTFRKNAQIETVMRSDDTTNYLYERLAGIEWESTSAITRVDIVVAGGNYDTGSTFRLYGVF